MIALDALVLHCSLKQETEMPLLWNEHHMYLKTAAKQSKICMVGTLQWVQLGERGTKQSNFNCTYIPVYTCLLVQLWER